MTHANALLGDMPLLGRVSRLTVYELGAGMAVISFSRAPSFASALAVSLCQWLFPMLSAVPKFPALLAQATGPI